MKLYCETVACSELEKDPESVNVMGTPFLGIHDVGGIISSVCEEITSNDFIVKEEMFLEELSDVKPDNPIETVLVNSYETVKCPEFEEQPESVNDMGTPFFFVGIKMEMPDDYESEASCENLETQYSSEEYPTNHERERKGVDKCSEGSSPIIQNSTSYVQVKMECEEDSEGELYFQTSNDTSVTTDTNCAFDSRSEKQGCDVGHSSEKFINGTKCQEYPILRVKVEGEHIDGQFAVNIKNSAFGRNVCALNTEEELNKIFDEAEQLKGKECVTEYVHDNNCKRKCNASKGKRIPCNVCRPIFDKGKSLKRQSYIGIHTDERPYSCDICEKSFFKKKNLHRHIRTHFGEKPFTCDICENSFTRLQNLKLHIRTHTGEKPFSCDICKNSFTRLHNLKLHIRTHTREKPFSCHYCDMCFNQKRSLKEHTLSHTGERPYSCYICKKSFTRPQLLKPHIRTHTGEKPFSCHYCDLCFNEKGSLKKHILVHTGERPYSCDICKKSFSQKQHLVRHFRTHTGEKPFMCHVCESSFADKSVLKRHLRTHGKGGAIPL